MISHIFSQKNFPSCHMLLKKVGIPSHCTLKNFLSRYLQEKILCVPYAYASLPLVNKLLSVPNYKISSSDIFCRSEHDNK